MARSVRDKAIGAVAATKVRPSPVLFTTLQLPTPDSLDRLFGVPEIELILPAQLSLRFSGRTLYLISKTSKYYCVHKKYKKLKKYMNLLSLL